MLVKVSPMLALVNGWRDLLCSVVSEEELREYRPHEEFVQKQERNLGRALQRRKPGRERSRRAN